MNVSKSIVVLSLLIIGFASVYAAANKPPLAPPVDAIPQPVPKPAPDPLMAQFMACAEECDACSRVCTLCEAHCIRIIADGRKDHLDVVRACQDCSDICKSAGMVTARNGPHSDLICTACIDACKRCGDLCQKHAEDPILKQCADECRRCEKTCREMLKQFPPKK